MLRGNEANIPITATDKTGRAFASVKKNLTGLSAATSRFYRGFGAMLGVGGLSAGITALTKSIIEQGSALSDAATAARIGIEEYQILRELARDAGVEMNTLTRALTKIQKSANDATYGVTTYIRAFDALGINIEEFRRLSPEQQFEMLGRAMVLAEDRARAYSAVMDIIGMRGVKLREVFERLGTDGFERLSKIMSESGRIMREETVNEFDRMWDQIEAFKQKIRIFFGKLVFKVGRRLGIFEDIDWEIEESKKKIEELKEYIKNAYTWQTYTYGVYQGKIKLKADTSAAEREIQRLEEKIARLAERKKELADADREAAAAADEHTAALTDNSSVIEVLESRLEGLNKRYWEMLSTPEQMMESLEDTVGKLYAKLDELARAGKYGTPEFFQTQIKAREAEIELERRRQTKKREDERAISTEMRSITASAGPIAAEQPERKETWQQRLWREREERLGIGRAEPATGPDNTTALVSASRSYTREALSYMRTATEEIKTLKAQLANER